MGKRECIENRILDYIMKKMREGDVSRIEEIIMSIAIDDEGKEVSIDIEGRGTKPIMQGYNRVLEQLINELDDILEEVMKNGECN